MNRDIVNSATWRKSSRSLNGNAECVEVALTPHAVGVRDSKDPSGPALVVSTSGWLAFINGVKCEALQP
ncbi:DUF397 domain-containing protein [Micromonospora andamanensis]|uniref:DUF397 domain-containing protein n=1 Tax=Micromonospora andamanensis TaxID=1287068 RepID=UPI00194F26E1|nr:DUF397 domain-containing protein [Micromonospora andamanensis]GIJ40530.1 hypothetical protein Vwe01_38550 [Micromonospora andamanensis]